MEIIDTIILQDIVTLQPNLVKMRLEITGEAKDYEVKIVNDDVLFGVSSPKELVFLLRYDDAQVTQNLVRTLREYLSEVKFSFPLSIYQREKLPELQVV
jgi:hypothetical protein